MIRSERKEEGRSGAQIEGASHLFPHVDRRRPSSVFTSTSTPSSAKFPVYTQFKVRAIAVYINYFCYSIFSSILCPSIWLQEHQKQPSLIATADEMSPEELRKQVGQVLFYFIK